MKINGFRKFKICFRCKLVDLNRNMIFHTNYYLQCLLSNLFMILINRNFEIVHNFWEMSLREKLLPNKSALREKNYLPCL